jgi:TonB family protein
MVVLLVGFGIRIYGITHSTALSVAMTGDDVFRRPLLLLLSVLVSACAGDPALGSFTPDADDGWVKVRCTVKTDGSVDNCQVVAESHTGLGLGAIALKAVSKARMTTDGSLREEASVNFTVSFAMEDGRLVERGGD